MNFRALENQSESWKSPGNLFLKKCTNPVLIVADFNFHLDHSKNTECNQASQPARI